MASVRKVRLYINVIIILYIAGGSGEETLKKKQLRRCCTRRHSRRDLERQSRCVGTLRTYLGCCLGLAPG
jgi:hypothetical protein